MKYEHMKEATRWYEYGQEKEFATKEEAIRKVENDTRDKLTEFYLLGMHRLIEENNIEDNGGAIRKVIKFKYPTSILE